MSRAIERTFLGALAACAVMLAGCGPDYERTDITAVRQSSLGGSVTYARIEVPAGMIVTAHIVSYNDDREEMASEIRSVDPGLVEVAQVVSPHDFAFFGVRPGATEVELRADGKVVLIIKAIVTEQPTPP